METERQRNTLGREKITKEAVKEAVALVRSHVALTAKIADYGTLTSRHEIFGVMVEKFRELGDAVHGAKLQDANAPASVKAELIGIAASCIFGIACIDSGTLDW